MAYENLKSKYNPTYKIGESSTQIPRLSKRVLDTAVETLARVGYGIVDTAEGVWDFGQWVSMMVQDLPEEEQIKRIKNITRDDIYTALSWGKESTKEDFLKVTKDSWYQNSKTGQLVGGVTEAIGQQLPMLLMTQGLSLLGNTPEAVATLTKIAQGVNIGYLGASAAGRSMNEASSEGATPKQAFAYGIGSGALESGIEMIGGDSITGIFPNIIKTKAGIGVGARLVRDAIGEGLEEVISDVANPLLKRITYDKDALKEYGTKDLWKGAGESFAIGGLSSLALGGMSYSGRALNIEIEEHDRLVEDYSKAKTKLEKEKIYAKIKNNANKISERINKLDSTERENYLKYINRNGEIIGQDGKVVDKSISMSHSLNADMDKIDVEIQNINKSLDEKNPSVKHDVKLADNFNKTQAQNLVKLARFVNQANEQTNSNMQFAILEDMDVANGGIVDGVIYINKDNLNDDTWMKTITHEGIHFVENTNPKVEADNKLFKKGDSYVLKPNVEVIQEKTDIRKHLDTELEGAYIDNKDFTLNDSGKELIDDLANRGYISQEKATELKNSNLPTLTNELITNKKFENEFFAVAGERILGNKGFINSVIRGDIGLANKILNKIDEREAKANLSETERKAYKKVKKAFTEALEEKGYRYYKGKIIGKGDKEDDTQFNYKTWNDPVIQVRDADGNIEYKTGREITKQVLTDRFGVLEAERVIKQVDQVSELVKELADKYENFRIFNDVSPYYRDDGTLYLECKVKNGEYAFNIDFSTICKKRADFTRFLNAYIEQGYAKDDGVNLSPEKIDPIRSLLKEHGLDTACSFCFVEARRNNINKWADSFIAKWNKMLDEMKVEAKYLSEIEDYDKVDVINGITEKMALDIDNLVYYDSQAIEHFEEQLAEKKSKGKRENTEDRMREILLKDSKQVVRLTKNDLLNIKAITTLKVKYPLIYSVMATSYGSNAPKQTLPATPYSSTLIYNEDFLKLYAGEDYQKEINMVGGLRLNSFSDFDITRVLDYVQLLADAQGKGLTIQAYTKELAEIKLFNKSNIKQNMSLVCNEGDAYLTKGRDYVGLNEDGSYAFDSESIAKTMDELVTIGSEYANGDTGFILVGLSREHILTALNDPRIHMIIPYHASGMPKHIRIINKHDLFTNYTYKQNTKIGGKNIADKNPFEVKKTNKQKTIKVGTIYKSDPFNDVFYASYIANKGNCYQAAQDYLDFCEDNGLTPRFDEFSKEKNYYKLLIDFNSAEEIDEDGNVTKWKQQQPIELNLPDNTETIIREEAETYGKHLEVYSKELDGLLKKAQYIFNNNIPESMVKSVREKQIKGIPLSEEEQRIFGKDVQFSFKEDSNGNTFVYNNKKSWSGSVNVLDGNIEETHSYKEAEKADFHHSMYFSETQVNKMDEGECVFFFADEGGIQIDATMRWDAIDKDLEMREAFLKQRIYEQIKPISDKTQFSLKDSLGNTLTKEQQDFFKDSKVRDENGNLLVVYRGTQQNEINVFDTSLGTYFTDDKTIASDYSKYRFKDKQNDGVVQEVYLNIKNPYIYDAKGKKWNSLKYEESNRDATIKRINESIKKTENVINNYTDNPLYYNQIKQWKYELKEYQKELKDIDVHSVNDIVLDIKNNHKEYDGVIIKNVIDSPISSVDVSNDYIAFESNQIKSIDNKKPTSSDDIRFSLKEEENWDKEDYDERSYGGVDEEAEQDINEIVRVNEDIFKGISKKEFARILNEELDFTLNDSRQWVLKNYDDYQKGVRFSLKSDVETELKKTLGELNTYSDEDLVDAASNLIGFDVPIDEAFEIVGEDSPLFEEKKGKLSKKEIESIANDLWFEIGTRSQEKRLKIANQIADRILSKAKLVSNKVDTETQNSLNAYKHYFHRIHKENIDWKMLSENYPAQSFNKWLSEDGIGWDDVVSALNERGQFDGELDSYLTPKLKETGQIEEFLLELEKGYRQAQEFAKRENGAFVSNITTEQKERIKKRLVISLMNIFNDPNIVAKTDTIKNEFIAEINKEREFLKLKEASLNEEYQKKLQDVIDRYEKLLSAEATRNESMYEKLKADFDKEVARLKEIIKDQDIHLANASYSLDKLSQQIASLHKSLAFNENRVAQFELNREITKISELRDNSMWNEVFENELILNLVKKIGRLRNNIGTISENAREVVKDLVSNKEVARYLFNISESELEENNPFLTILEDIASGEGKLTTEELRNLKEAFTSLRYNLQNINKVWFENRRQDEYDIARQGLQDADTTLLVYSADYTARNKVTQILNTSVNFIASPEYVFEKMSNFDGKYLPMRMFNELVEGNNKKKRFKKQTSYIQEWIKEHKNEIKDWREANIDIDGHKLSMTQIISLVALSRREQAINHIFGNGGDYVGRIKITDMKAREKSVKDSVDKATTIEIGYDFISKAEEKLTPLAKEYMELQYKFFNEDSRQAFVETQDALYGTHLSPDANYFPIRTDKDQFYQTFGNPNVNDLYTIFAPSFAKKTIQHAKNLIVVEDCFDVVIRHQNQMATYYGLAVPIRTINRILNRAVDGESLKVKYRSIDKDFVPYLNQLMSDLQNPRQTNTEFERIFNVLRGWTIKATLSWNVKVWASQITSLPNAHSLGLKYKNIALGLTNAIKHIKDTTKEMMEKSIVAWDRYNSSGFNQDLVDAFSKDGATPKSIIEKYVDAGMSPIQAIDMFTVSAIYEATKIEYGITENSTQEEWDKMISKFEKVVNRTQPSYDTLYRSELLRNPSFLTKMISMYKTQPLQQLSQLLEGVSQYYTFRKLAKQDSKYETDFKRAKKELVQKISGVTMSVISYSIIGTLFAELINAGRRDDDKDVFAELGSQILNASVGMIPVVTDIVSAFSGYENQDLYYSSIGNFVSAVTNLTTTVANLGNPTEQSKRKVASGIRSVILTASSVFGVPTKNVEKYLRGVSGVFSPTARLSYDNLYYTKSQKKLVEMAKKGIDSGDEYYAEMCIEIMLQDAIGDVSKSVSKEIVRLLDNDISVSIKSAPSGLTKKQLRIFNNEYKKALRKVEALIKSREYRKLDDSEKAKAINRIFNEYYNSAKEKID